MERIADELLTLRESHCLLISAPRLVNQIQARQDETQLRRGPAPPTWMCLQQVINKDRNKEGTPIKKTYKQD